MRDNLSLAKFDNNHVQSGHRHWRRMLSPLRCHHRIRSYTTPLFFVAGDSPGIIGGVHLLCDEAGLRDFLQQLGIATVLCLLFCLKAVAKVHGEGQEQPG